jgi:prenylcysteine oxidase/farnesylcysteine lyase
LGWRQIFRSNKNGLLNNLKIFSKYHSSVLKVLHLLTEAKKQLAEFYLQAQKGPAEIGSLFESTGLNKYYSKPFDAILTEAGVNQAFIDEAVSPITRTIYSQNADLSGFAGLASLIGVYGHPIYRFTEGNNTFPVRLVEASNAKVKQNQKITNIERTAEGSYRLSSETDSEIFDNIIIATPFELADIEFDEIKIPIWKPQQYQTMFTKVKLGIFNPTYFGVNNATDAPAIVLTTKKADPITHYSIHKTQNDQSIVTLTSTEPISDDLFDEILSKSTPVLEHSWKATYPKFKPILKLPPTQLDNGLFYVNAVEPAVSSMETSALSALNCVKMISKQ